ncbi:Ig-like domain-containing protein [Paenibacillus sp. GXUN7292]|uniref:Ig-like domain-containing protein n=1 Tax=Paenibacillus sp. GXUN7292 TaxID=3422499 RepID=UPI003D7C943F
MKWKNKLSLFVAVMMVLSFIMTGWGGRQETASAASSGPVVMSQFPANGSTNVSRKTSSPMTILFDEPVRIGQSNAKITIHLDSNNSIVNTINASSVRISSDGKEVTFYRTVQLDLNTTYYVQIEAGAFQNISNGSPFIGIGQPAQWRFTTSDSDDTARPVITGVSPVHQSANVPVMTSLIVDFDKTVYSNGGEIELEGAGDVRKISITSTEVIGSGSSRIIITPKDALRPNTQYTVKLPAALFRDGNGNLSDYRTWNFKTEASPVNLQATDALFPSNNAFQVPSNTSFVMRFDKNVVAQPNKNIDIIPVSTGTRLSIPANSSQVTIVNNEVTIRPSSRLTANVSYYIVVEPGAFSERGASSDRIFSGITSTMDWRFTTAPDDNNPPTISQRTPTGSGAGVNTPLVITFNEPVFPGDWNGKLEVRQVTGDKLLREIPATSSRISGWGTNTITVNVTGAISGEASAPYLNNTQYYVKISNTAIRDAAGNAFRGITNTTEWRFSVTTVTEGPYLVGMTPEDGANPVAVDETFTAIFNKPVKVSSIPRIWFNQKDGSVTPISASDIMVDSKDSKAITFKPSVNLTANRDYYITIADDAISDLVDNYFVGIDNTNRWTFKTVGGDTTPPAISSSEASGSIIRLIYNEPLNAKIKTSPASYAVKVAGIDRQVTKVDTAGNMVTLTISGTIGSNHQVKVSYTRPATNPVQDLSGNFALSFDNLEVKNGLSSSAPALSSGSASGNTVILNFNQPLSSVNSYASSQFTVYVNGTSYVPSSLSVSGSSVILYINTSIASGSTVRVSYTPGSYPLTGQNGLRVGSISSYTISQSSTGGNYQYPPALQYITASGTSVILKYNKTLNPNTVPTASQYSVLVNSAARSIQSVSISGDSVYLTLTSGIQANQTVSVTYVGSTSFVNDYYGYFAPSFSNILANQGSSGGSGLPASMQSAIIKGSIVTLSFTEPLQYNNSLPTSMFMVRVNDSVRLVNNVNISGNSIILTLTSPAQVGERVVVYYTQSDNGLKTANGVLVSSFNNVNVVNQTTLIDTLTGDYEVVETNAILLKTSTATTSSSVSPAGTSASKYKINNENFITAVTTSHNAGISNPRIVFRVPSTERAGVVSIPVIALEMSQKISGNVTWIVQHGDASYELPLKGLNFAELSRYNNGSGISNEVVISIDEGTSTFTSDLTRAISNSKATMIAGPVYYEVAVMNGSSRKEITSFGSYVTRTISTSSSVNYSQTAAVWVDPVTGLLTYVPTLFKQDGNRTIAVFKRQGNSAYALVRNTATFTDIAKHWSAEDVLMMSRKFIVEGYSATKFEPQKQITRGEFATYVAKGLGLEGDRTAAAKFKDVNANTVMGAYIGAAAKAGIVNGKTTTTFKPNDPIKREEMAAMMMRAAKVAGITDKLPQSVDTYLSVYSDRSKISAYAKTDMANAIYLGIINGKTKTTLSPQTNATRAEGTVMIRRLLEKAEFLTP